VKILSFCADCYNLSNPKRSHGHLGSPVIKAAVFTWKAATLPLLPLPTVARRCASSVTSGKREQREWPCSRNVSRLGAWLRVRHLTLIWSLINFSWNKTEELDALTNTSANVSSLGLHVKVCWNIHLQEMCASRLILIILNNIFSKSIKLIIVEMNWNDEFIIHIISD